VVLASIKEVKSVTLSDRIESVLQNIKFNLDLNNINSSKVVIQNIDWTAENPTIEKESVDIIVASDVVYDNTAAESVPIALCHYLLPTGVAVLVLPSQREGISLFEQNMKKKRIRFYYLFCRFFFSQSRWQFTFLLIF